MPTVGNFPLTGVAALPHVTVAFPGEHWSDAKASAGIVPGDAVVPASVNGQLYVRKATAGDSGLANQLSIALKTIQYSDSNTGVGSLGPNEIVNKPFAVGEWVHYYRSGAFWLTLIAADGSYAPGDLVGWDADAARHPDIGGTGAWAKNSAADIDSIFEVVRFKPIGGDGFGRLLVKSIRGQHL